MKKISSLFIALFLIFNTVVFAEPDSAAKNPPELRSEAAILLDLKTGRVLYSKNENERLYPASTTKILTAILALEKGNLSDVITASAEAIDPITSEDSNVGILRGEQMTLEQLVY